MTGLHLILVIIYSGKKRWNSLFMIVKRDGSFEHIVNRTILLFLKMIYLINVRLFNG